MPADLTPAEIEAMRLRASGEPLWSALPPHTPLEDDLSADVMRLLAVVDALTARLAEAPAVVVTQGAGFTEERLRREEAERRLAEAYEYVERERDAARREGLEEAQRIAADLSIAYLEKHGGGGDYCAARSALTMALAAKVTP